MQDGTTVGSNNQRAVGSTRSHLVGRLGDRGWETERVWQATHAQIERIRHWAEKGLSKQCSEDSPTLGSQRQISTLNTISARILSRIREEAVSTLSQRVLMVGHMTVRINRL